MDKENQPSWIVLNNRTLWMSADEYAGGSFQYAQNINISKNTKSFRLADHMETTIMTSRDTYYVALLSNSLLGWVIISKDWYIESTLYFNERNTKLAEGSYVLWGSIYNVTYSYYNAIKIWTKNICIWATTVDVFTWDLTDIRLWLVDVTAELVTTPALTSDTWRTVWAGWTTWSTGAVHSSWTATLTQNITVDSGVEYRVAIKSSWCTTWSCVVSLWWTTVATITSTSPLRSMWKRTTASTSEALTFTPTTTFNWTIHYASVLKYNASKIEIGKATISNSLYHPVVHIWEYLYVGSGAKLDSIDLVSYSVDTYSLIEASYSIVWIHEVWQSLVIFATDWEDSKQYYRDKVSDAPSEVITRKDKKITNTKSDWVYIYVMCETDYRSQLYIVSWYTKTLVAQGKDNYADFWQDKEAYRIAHRNDFYSKYPNAMGYINNKAYIPAYNWVYTYWYDTPWMKAALTKEFVLDCETISVAESVLWLTHLLYQTKTTPVTVNLTTIREYDNIVWSWYVISNPILWDNFWTSKQLNHFRIWYIIPEATSKIDIYISANKFFFRTFYATTTIAPSEWDTYTDVNWNMYKVISLDSTTISCIVDNLVDSQFTANGTLTRNNWNWDATITYTDSDCFVKVKTITATKYTIWNELIFWQEFLDAYMPNWNVIQLKIKLTSATATWTPEVFDIPVLAQSVGQNA